MYVRFVFEIDMNGWQRFKLIAPNHNPGAGANVTL
jgi:hypothetical protein